jgi:osmotically-inducible protein OsmY
MPDIGLCRLEPSSVHWSVHKETLMKNDMQIQSEVVAELDREPRIAAGTIGAEVHHGVVKLSGRVSDGAIKEIAALAARRVSDVTNVVMDIDVTGAGTVAQPSEKIARVA